MSTTQPAKMIKNYQILIPQSTWQTSVKYFNDLRALEAGNQATCTPADGGALRAGRYFQSRLQSSGILSDGTLTGSAFYHAMMHQFINTKKPQIFAESTVSGRAEKDWSPNELHILGDIAIAVPVTIYDNGNHRAHAEDVHETPFQGTLLYVPGALLNNNRGQIPCDLPLVANRNGNDWIIDQDKVNSLYERRLLPSLMYANTVCKNSSTTALITMPGLGCGMFAGEFQGQMGEHLRKAIEYILTKHGENLDSVKAVYYDPYGECEYSSKRFGGIPFMVRPLLQTLLQTGGTKIARQLDSPKVFNEVFDDTFDNCHLFSFVAWDHVSWPGNDYWIGRRATDDGVKAAATSSMGVMTGYEGEYNQSYFVYEPPKDLEGVGVWKDVVSKFCLEIDVWEGVNFHIEGLV